MQHEPDQGLREIELAFQQLCAEQPARVAARECSVQPGAEQVMLKEYHALRLRLESELRRYVSQYGAGEELS